MNDLFLKGGCSLGFYDRLKLYIKRHAKNPNEFLGANLVKKSARTLSIQFKHYFRAQDIASAQETIDTIATRIIKKDKTNRYYAGKTDDDIKDVKEKIYKYESFKTQSVNLVPRSDGEFDLYIEGIDLGQLPDSFSNEVRFYLQTTIFNSFAYIMGGPYKYFDREKQIIVEDFEPYDLSIYIQFS